MLLDLQQRTGARAGFLGSSMDDLQPSRRLTLLFDIQEEDAAALQALVLRVEPVILELKALSALHQPPCFVNTRDRTRECKECGNLDKAHDCPFMPAMRLAQSLRRPAAPQPADPSQPQRPAAAAPALQPDDKMCRAWRRSATCPRQQQCKWEHPPDHQPQFKPCFSFRDSGHCDKGDLCRFMHGSQLPAAPAPEPVLAAAANEPQAMETEQDQAQAQPQEPTPPAAAQQASAAAAPSPAKEAPLKKRKSCLPASEPSNLEHANSFDALVAEDDKDSRSWAEQCADEAQASPLRKRTPSIGLRGSAASAAAASAPPVSSLSSLSAPASSSQEQSPTKKRRNAASSATNAPAAAASAVALAPSRSNSTSRR